MLGNFVLVISRKMNSMEMRKKFNLEKVRGERMISSTFIGKYIRMDQIKHGGFGIKLVEKQTKSPGWTIL